MALLPVHSSNYSQIRKCSYRKACRRALRDADTVTYRGQPLTPQQVCSQGHCPPQATPRPSHHSGTRRGGRQFRPMRVLSWNPGHLGVQQWSEIKDWLAQEAETVCDVLLLQETHWSSSAQFTVSGWTCVSSASDTPPATESRNRGRGSSGKPPPPQPRRSDEEDVPTSRADGVIALLSPRIAPGQIRWREHVVGRVLEVRLTLEGSPHVVMCVYQHVWSSAKTPQQNRKDRSHVMASLGKALKQVPSRLSLVVAGDFNSSLSACPRLIGPRTCVESHMPDSEGFQELVSSHNLVALNTWHAPCPHTFSQQGSKSQIDFILTKESQAGGQAKWAKPLEEWRLGSWKTGGHTPILAVIKPVSHWMLPARAPALVYDPKALQHAVRENTEAAQNMKDWVRQRMPAGHPDECNRILQEASALFFPRQRRATQTAPDAQNMWRLVRELNATPSPDPALKAELETAQRRHKQIAKQRQKERAQKFLQDVDEAIAEGSSYVAYSTLKQLRPWQPPRRAQLKNKEGKLMNPADELQTSCRLSGTLQRTHSRYMMPCQKGRDPSRRLSPSFWQSTSKPLSSTRRCRRTLPRRPPGNSAQRKSAPH